MSSLLILLVGALVSGSVPVSAQSGVDWAPAPSLALGQPASVTGNTYTSPQFGYSVSWSNAWRLGKEPASEHGQYDDLWLTNGVGDVAYAGIYTPLNSEELVAWYVQAVQEDRPEARIIRKYFTGSPLLLRYSEGDELVIAAVSAIPLVPGSSMLLIVQVLPADMPYEERADLENQVVLLLYGAATASGNRSAAESRGLGGPGTGETVRLENDPERIYEEIYTVSVYCQEVHEGIWGVSGHCDWPLLLPDPASCIEADSYQFGGGRSYLCKPAGYIRTDGTHPDEVTLQNDPEAIYSVSVHCENVTEQYGTTYGDCDWPLLGSRDCIEDKSQITFGDDKYYLCKP